MRIEDIRTIHLVYRNPDGKKRRWSGGYFDSWSSVFVQVIADDGTTGLGEVYQGSCVAEAVPAFIGAFKPWLAGESPLDPALLWEKVHNLSHYWNRGGFPMGVLGGIDIALHDLAGKAQGVPVHRLLGGAVRGAMPVYYSAGCSEATDELVSELEEARQQGYSAYKWRLLDLNDGVEKMKRLRQAAGEHFEIIVDAVQGSAPTPWPIEQVFEFARRIESCRPLWLEEPFRTEDLAAHADLRKWVSYAVAGGESVTSSLEAERLLDAGALDIFQPDLTVAGGFTACRKLALLAATRNAPLAMHCWGGGVSLMANLHFGLTVPGCQWVEHCKYYNPLREELLAEPLEIRGGKAALPAVPGLGVRLTQETIERYSPQSGSHTGLVFELK